MKCYLIQINKGINGYSAKMEVAAESEEEAIAIAKEYLSRKGGEIVDYVSQWPTDKHEVRWCSVVLEDFTLDIVNTYDMHM